MGFAQQSSSGASSVTSITVGGTAVAPSTTLASGPAAVVVDSPKTAASVDAPPAQTITIPDWALGLLKGAKTLPVVGPILSQVMMYVGIIGGILTSFIAFLLAALGSVSGIAAFSGAAGLVKKIQDFKNSAFMMWLMAFSNIPMAHPGDVSEMKKEIAADKVS